MYLTASNKEHDFFLLYFLLITPNCCCHPGINLYTLKHKHKLPIYKLCRCNFTHQPAALWPIGPPQIFGTRPSGSASAIAGTVFGWVLWVTEHQQWQNVELAWSQLLRVIQT